MFEVTEQEGSVGSQSSASKMALEQRQGEEKRTSGVKFKKQAEEMVQKAECVCHMRWSPKFDPQNPYLKS